LPRISVVIVKMPTSLLVSGLRASLRPALRYASLRLGQGPQVETRIVAARRFEVETGLRVANAQKRSSLSPSVSPSAASTGTPRLASEGQPPPAAGSQRRFSLPPCAPLRVASSPELSAPLRVAPVGLAPNTALFGCAARGQNRSLLASLASSPHCLPPRLDQLEARWLCFPARSAPRRASSRLNLSLTRRSAPLRVSVPDASVGLSLRSRPTSLSSLTSMADCVAAPVAVGGTRLGCAALRLVSAR
jgi:hypothetical protein